MKTNQQILVGGNDDLSIELCRELEISGFEAVKTSANALDILFQAMQVHPTGCILSTDLDNRESLIEKLSILSPKPYIYELSHISPRLQRKRNENVSYIQLPITAKRVVSIIKESIENETLGNFLSNNYLTSLHNSVSDILATLCITPNYNGFIFLREAIKLAAKEQINSRSFSKNVYPKIAKLYHSSPASVERNIRTVILKGWEKTATVNKVEIFGAAAGNYDWHPTNGEVILTIADKVNRELQCLLEIAN